MTTAQEFSKAIDLQIQADNAQVTQRLLDARKEMNRVSWILNVKRILGFTQEHAEMMYQKIQPYGN